MALSRQQILDSQDLKTVDIDVPEWGGNVRIRMFSGKERDEFLVKMQDGTRERVAGTSALLVMLSVIDDDGNRLFKEADLTTINGKSGAVLGRIAAEVMVLNQMGQQGAEEAEKNSEKGQTD